MIMFHSLFKCYYLLIALTRCCWAISHQECDVTNEKPNNLTMLFRRCDLQNLLRFEHPALTN